MTLLQQHILEVLSCLEQEIAKPCVVDCTGIVTNHMRAAWGARDTINELFMPRPVDADLEQLIDTIHGHLLSLIDWTPVAGGEHGTDRYSAQRIGNVLHVSTNGHSLRVTVERTDA